MEKNDRKKNFYYSFKKIKKIWLPIILTFLIIFNVPFIPNSVGTNENINFQPSGPGETFFFPSSYFKQKNNKNGNNNDGNIALLVLFLFICIIIGIVYYIFYKLKDVNEEKEDRHDYMELLKDDSDYEGNI